MTVRYPEAARQHKALLQLLVLEILKNNTDPGNPITKQKIIEKATELCGFEPARNTIYDDIDALIDAGFPIEQSRKGVYYDGKSLSDGELRFLIDSVLYSDLMTKNGASEVIEALASLGSVEFQKYMEKQKARISITRKGKQPNMFMAIEDIQTAIYYKKQISFNYLTYRPDCTQEKVYTKNITVNPYDLVYKNGRYYLLGALYDEKKICSWRVDRLCDVELLKTGRRDIPQLKEISALGGMNAYVDTQPDLCGGLVETFKIQCATDAIDEIVDVFGGNFSEAPEQINNYDDETVILSVKATRESMKAWAFTHAGRMVVVSPEDFRKEITESISEAERLYRVTGKPLHIRIFTAKNFTEAIRFSLKRTGKTVLYHGKGRYLGKGEREKEQIDLTLLNTMPDIISLSLNECILDNASFLNHLPYLRRLHLVRCELPDNTVTELENIEELQTDDLCLALKLTEKSTLSSLSLLSSDITDTSFISKFSTIHNLTLAHCKKLVDCSSLQSAEQIEKLEISSCDSLIDFSFLDRMSNLKELRIDCSHMAPTDFIRIRKALEKRGIRVYSRFLRDYYDDNMEIRPGMNPENLD